MYSCKNWKCIKSEIIFKVKSKSIPSFRKILIIINAELKKSPTIEFGSSKILIGNFWIIFHIFIIISAFYKKNKLLEHQLKWIPASILEYFYPQKLRKKERKSSLDIVCSINITEAESEVTKLFTIWISLVSFVDITLLMHRFFFLNNSNLLFCFLSPKKF